MPLFVKIMACRLFSAKPLSELMLICWPLHEREKKTSEKIE